jgi:ketosteroid isomerase-like protein
MSQATNEALETFHQFLGAVMAQSLERILPFFNEDAQMFSPLGTYPSRLDGRAAIGKQFASILEAVKSQAGGALKIEPQDLDARELAPNVVQLTFHLRMAAGPLHRRSFVMLRGASGWRIGHIHASIASPA